MKKSELTDEWQYAVVRVKVRARKSGGAEMLARGGRLYLDTMYVTPAEIRHVIPVDHWPTRKQIEGLDAAT